MKRPLVLDTETNSAYALVMDRFSTLSARIATECPAVRVREVSRLLARVYDAALRPVGLQSSQLSVLVAVARFGESGAKVGLLANRLVMERTTLTRNIQPLEKAGLLRVSRSPDDARARVITLTRAGERMIETAFPLWERATERVRALLGARRLDALRAELAGVIEVAPQLDVAAGA